MLIIYIMKNTSYTLIKNAILLITFFLFTEISNAQYSNKTGNFSLRILTAAGFPSLEKINGGYYKGDKVNSDGLGRPWYDFKYQPLYILVGGYARFKKFEYGLEFGRAIFKSDVNNGGIQQVSELKFTPINFDMKYYLFEMPQYKLYPFLDGQMNALFTSYTDTRTGYDEVLHNNMFFLVGISVGTDYKINEHFSATAKIGVGAFETLQFGMKYNFKEM